MYGYIYKTTNLINNRIYIGQHKCSEFDINYFGSGILIKSAIKKYGINNFECEILEWCETKEKLEEREIYWIDYYDSCNSEIGYNLSYGGFTPRFKGKNHPMYGKHHSEESKQKTRLSKLGKKQSQDVIDKRTATLKPIFEKKKQDRINKWISEKHKCEYCGEIMTTKYGKGRFCNSVCVSKHIAELSRGRKVGDSTIEKLRMSHIGQKSYWAGKHRDESTKQKISESLSLKPRYYRRIVYSVDNHIFNGLDEGADYFNITKSCMSLWIKKGKTADNKPINILVDNQMHRTK